MKKNTHEIERLINECIKCLKNADLRDDILSEISLISSNMSEIQYRIERIESSAEEIDSYQYKGLQYLEKAIELCGKEEEQE